MTERRSLVEGLKSRPETDRSLEEQFIYGNRTPRAEEPPKTRARPQRPKAAKAPTAPKGEETPKVDTAEPATSKPAKQEAGTATATRPAAIVSRVPFTTRLRADMAQAVKRASLERQLEGVEPNTVQEILEDALEPWLRANGYLQ
ncbi:hypothetical protein [Tautonia rosea]|uniref:hypothetical protein n=1 Tax=Tautonia rosea TaxID=2728037 RepID=UPI0014766FB5|nr:hypothetical protein [Tautonia rosea]